MLNFNLPAYPIFNHFHFCESPQRIYRGNYICGTWYAKFSYDENSEVLIPRSSLTDRGTQYVSWLVNNDPEFTTFIYEKFSAISDLADTLEEINYQEIKNNTIPEIVDYFKEYKELFPWVIGLGYAIDVALEDYVLENNIMLDSIVIPGESFIAKEKKELAEIVSTSCGEELQSLRADHMARYSYLMSNYTGYHAINPSYFTDRIKEKIKGNKKYEMPKKPSNILEWIGYATYIRDERKRCNMIFNALYSRYLMRECTKMNLAYKDAVMLTPEEFETQKQSGSLQRSGGHRIMKSTHERPGFTDISSKEWLCVQKEKTSHEVTGTIASKGCYRGNVSIVMNNTDFKKVQKGDVVVASMTRPDFAPILHLAGAIVTNEGGVTCHAAIISREMKIPCIISTTNATVLLHDGDVVEVDADEGIVHIETRQSS